jgi:hypothetical protein
MTAGVEVHLNDGIQIDAWCCDRHHEALIGLTSRQALALAHELVAAVLITDTHLRRPVEELRSITDVMTGGRI